MYIFAILAFLTGTLNLFLGVYSFSVSAKRGVNLLFLIFSSLLALWSLLYAFVYISPTKEYAWIFYKISSIGWVFFPPVLLHFAILLRNKKYPYKKATLFLAYLPPVIYQIRIFTDYLLTVDLHHTKLGWIHVFNKEDAIWIYSFIIYLLIYVIFAAYNVFMYGREAIYKSQKKQANTLLIAAIGVTVFGTLSDIFVPRFLENQTVPAMANIFTAIWVIGASIAIVRYKLMVLSTSIASDTILKKVKDLLILLNPAYRILEINKQVEELLGYTIDDLKGEKINSLFEKSFLIDFELAKLDSKVNNESTFETNLVANNKKLIPVGASISKEKDNKGDVIGYVLIAHDLRDLRRLKDEIEEKNVVTEALKNSELKFKEFLEFLPLSVAEVSLNRKISYVNDAVLKLFGYDRDEVNDTFDILRVIHPNDHGRLQFNYTRSIISRKKEDEINEYTAVRKNGTIFPIRVYTNTIFEDKKIVGLRVIFIDISEQKKHEESLREAKEKAEIANKAKSSFIANTSHEIRTPLNAIIGYTNLLAKQDLTEEQKRFIKNIKTSGDNLLSVINDILEYSKIQSVNIELKNIDFDIRNEIELLINAIKVRADEKNISLIVHIDKNIPDFIVGDPVRLGQVLNNLIGNAIKFTNQGGAININVFLSREILQEVELRFIIEDTGIGIPEDKIETIFDSFNQVDYNTTRKYGGTGLGLAIVKQIIEAHDSKIYVSSVMSKGSKFSFNIVYRKSTGDLIKSKITEKEIALCKLHPKGLKILLAEDNKTNQEIVVDTINTWDNTIKIDIADNGKIAIEKLSSKDYDLLLLDMQMPEMDGYDVARYIRNNMPIPKKDIPIFAMTANTMKEEIQKCIELGMNEYFSKPFSPDDLYRKIRLYTCSEIVERRRRDELIDYSCLYCKLDFTTTREIKQKSVNQKPEFKILDFSQLEKIYKGNSEKISEMVSRIAEEIPKELIELIKSNEFERWDDVKGHAHTIKTKMLYIGAQKSYEISKQIEQICNIKEETEKIPNLISQLNEQWVLIEQELKSI